MNSLGNRIIVGAPLSDLYGGMSGYARSFENPSLLFVPDVPVAIKMNVYPNPNRGVVTIKFSETLAKANITIFDVGGRIVYSEEFLNTDEARLNNNLPSGVYPVSVQTDQETTNLKMIVE